MSKELLLRVVNTKTTNNIYHWAKSILKFVKIKK